MRSPPWLHVVAAVAFALPVSCGGCERRVEEPVTVGPRPNPTEVEVEPLAARPPPQPNRCVRPTPEKAVRNAPPSPDPSCPRDPETPPHLRSAKVMFPEATGSASVDVEVADNDHDRQRGLMYRKSMAAAHGMIFRFEEKSNHAFWMHNTCIPLDMLYIDDDGLIVGIEENTPTMSDATFAVGCESKYVLEVNAGWTRAHGVRAGQRAKLEGL